VARPIYKRLEVVESKLEATINSLLAHGWAIAGEPEAQDQKPVEFFREKIKVPDLVERVNALVADGWENVHWDEKDDEGDEWKDMAAVVHATKFEEPRFKIVALKSLSKSEEIRLLREALEEKDGELEVLAAVEDEEDLGPLDPSRSTL
jgi:hypothetical protein